MKKSKLKQIIREEYYNVTGKHVIMEESLITKILYLFLAPKVKRDVNKIKKTPEYIELERQAKLAADELETISKKLERVHDAQIELEKDAKKHGIPYKAGMTTAEIKALYPSVFKKSK